MLQGVALGVLGTRHTLTSEPRGEELEGQLRRSAPLSLHVRVPGGDQASRGTLPERLPNQRPLVLRSDVLVPRFPAALPPKETGCLVRRRAALGSHGSTFRLSSPRGSGGHPRTRHPAIACP